MYSITLYFATIPIRHIVHVSEVLLHAKAYVYFFAYYIFYCSVLNENDD